MDCNESVEDDLLDTKVRTGNVRGQIICYGVLYRPKTSYIDYMDFDNDMNPIRKHKVLDIDETLEFYEDAVKKGYLDDEKYNTESLDSEDLKDLLTAFDEFFCLETNNLSLIDTGLLPTLSIGFKSELGDKWIINTDILTENPNLLNHISVNCPININTDSNVAKINDHQFSFKLYRDFQKFKNMYDKPVTDVIVDSNPYYNYWFKINKFNLSKENDSIEISIRNNKTPVWKFENPEEWSSDYDIVELVENLANGDPNLLDFIYIAPNDIQENENISTKSDVSEGWMIALEDPKKLEEDDQKILKNVYNKIFK